MRFVADLGGERLYRGPTFMVPRAVGPSLAPEEAWAPGMGESLWELQREVERDGWLQAGRGKEPWSFRYRRPTGERVNA